jgi:dienelactone hydrolase
MVTLRRAVAAMLAVVGAAACDAGSRRFGLTGQDFAVQDSAVSFVNAVGDTVTARLFVPEGSGPFPAVVVLHGCEGMLADSVSLNDEFAFWGDTLRSGGGLVVLITNSYEGRGVDAGCGTADTALQDSIVNADTLVSPVVDRVHDAFAALEYLRGQAYVVQERIAVVGFASGGSATLSALAANGRPVALPAAGGFTTALAYYPECVLDSVFGAPGSGTWLPYAPVRIFHGSLDSLQADCDSLVTRAISLGAGAGTGNAVTLSTFAGAKHGFDRAVTGDTAWTLEDLAARDAARASLLDILRAM